jgi:hypothetical protein
MSERRTLILSTDLGEFFRSEVSQARSDLGLELTELTEYYVVNLLCDFSRRTDTQPEPGGEPLALMYKRALEAPPAQRLQILKGLGDLALYVSGFFAEMIEKSLVDIDYYVSMGGQAYANASTLVGRTARGDQFAELYDQLAKRFTELVDLLAQISDRNRGATPASADLLKLYDRWARTGSARIRKLLIEKGLVPPSDDPSTEYIQ